MAASIILRYIRAVKYRSLDQAQLLSQLKRLVADMFGLDIIVSDDIADDAPLTGGSFDLDSFDMLELAICIEESFGVAIRTEEAPRIVFTTIASLADFIHLQTQIGQEHRKDSAAHSSVDRAVRSLPVNAFA